MPEELTFREKLAKVLDEYYGDCYTEFGRHEITEFLDSNGYSVLQLLKEEHGEA